MKNIALFNSPFFLILFLLTLIINAVIFALKKVDINKKIGKIKLSDILSSLNMIIYAAMFIGYITYSIFTGKSTIPEEELLMLMLISGTISLFLSNMGKEK